MAAEAWATYKLLPSDEWITAPEEPPNSQFVSDEAGLIKESLGFEECEQENIQDWLEYHSYLVLTDEQDSCECKEEPSSDHAEKGRSSEEVFHCLETAMKWLEQEECEAVQLPSKTRYFAAKKKKRTKCLL
ncbi:hypothetical protein PR048_028903 [Dryococelus australis]|uniref:Uncharacterized protein n=1 Tax=Dryococelus australis TaxID=614101 RepID=A0ABQ9GFJ6_9NEOP|nr:hypothetical protein PR048_028903 [Dryococelus australis]